MKATTCINLSINATRTLELPISFFLYLSTRTELFPEFIQTTVDEACKVFFFFNFLQNLISSNVNNKKQIGQPHPISVRQPYLFIFFRFLKKN